MVNVLIAELAVAFFGEVLCFEKTPATYITFWRRRIRSFLTMHYRQSSVVVVFADPHDYDRQ